MAAPKYQPYGQQTNLDKQQGAVIVNVALDNRFVNQCAVDCTDLTKVEVYPSARLTEDKRTFIPLEGNIMCIVVKPPVLFEEEKSAYETRKQMKLQANPLANDASLPRVVTTLNGFCLGGADAQILRGAMARDAPEGERQRIQELVASKFRFFGITQTSAMMQSDDNGQMYLPAALGGIPASLLYTGNKYAPAGTLLTWSVPLPNGENDYPPRGAYEEMPESKPFKMRCTFVMEPFDPVAELSPAAVEQYVEEKGRQGLSKADIREEMERAVNFAKVFNTTTNYDMRLACYAARNGIGSIFDAVLIIELYKSVRANRVFARCITDAVPAHLVTIHLTASHTSTLL